MKKILFLILELLFVQIASADTVNIDWSVDGQTYTQTTCTVGGDIILPTAPTKRGHTFLGWAIYTPIEYIESTGTQYIDTGFMPNQNSGMEIDVYSIRSNDPNFAGVFDGTYFWGCNANSGVSTTNFIVSNGSASNYWRAQGIFGGGTGRYQITIDKANMSIKASNGQIYTRTSAQSAFQITGYDLWLFADNRARPQLSSTRIYGCKLYDNDTLVRDFIPVLDPNGTPCMYDNVSKTFFYNAGTGNFIAGPVINQ